MPQIPLSNKAGMLRHTSDAVPMTGAPGMDHGMDGARAIAQFGERIGQTGLHLSDAMFRFAEATRDAEDRLAEREYLTAYAEHEGELEKRMAANPGSVEQFGQWAIESDRAWEEKGKPFLERMSARHRNLFAEQMNATRVQSRDRRMRISFAASATRQHQAFLDNFNANCMRGDFEGAAATLDAARNVIHPAEIEKLRATIPARQEEWNYRQSIAAGKYDEVIDALRSDDYQGHLSADKRHSIEREAVQRRYEDERKQDDAFLARLADGEDVPTQEFLREQHEAGILSDRQFAKWSGWLKSYEAGERMEEQRAQTARAAEARTKRADAKERAACVLVAEVIGKASPNDAAAYEKLWRACDGDVFAFLQYRKSFAEMVKEKKSKDNIWTMPEGRIVKEFCDGQKKGKALVYGKGWIWSDNDEPAFQAQQYVELLQYAKSRLLANNMNVELTIKDCKARIAMLNDRKIRNILAGVAVANEERDRVKRKTEQDQKGGKNGR